MEINKETLYFLYIEKRKTTTQIAKIFSKSPSTIGNYLKKYNIPTRKNKEAQVNKIFIDKNILYNLYIIQKKSLLEIANIFKCSEESIRRKCIDYGIDRRNKTLNFGGQNKGIPLSEKQKKDLSKIKKNYYKKHKHWNKGNSWNKEVREKISLKLLNGRDPAPSYYGSDWRINRTSCLQRDKYTCQFCGSIEHLEVHHWTPYRFSFDNSLDNLISLCEECHKELHKEYIQEGFIKEAEEDYYYENV